MGALLGADLDDLDAIGIGARLAAGTDAADPGWIGPLDSAQRSLRTPVPVALDTLLSGAAVLAVTGDGPAALAGAGAFLAGGLVLGLWKYRSTLEAQGTLWYAYRAAPAAAVTGVAAFATGIPTLRAAASAAAALGVLVAVHLVMWVTLGAARRSGRGLRPALVVGGREHIATVAHRIAMYPEAGLRVAGSYVPAPGDCATPAEGKALVDGLIERHRVEHVICVASPGDGTVFKDFVRFAAGRVDFSFVFPLSRLCRGFTHVGDLNVAAVPMRTSWGSEAAKRLFDIVASGLALVVLSPVLAAIALAVKVGDPGPAIFRQRRPGRGSEPFTIYKFRSMYQTASQSDFHKRDEVGKFGFKFAGDPRITPVGAFIRRFSLDEVPQLWNVLKGDMSLVGPRPLPFDPDDFDQRARIRFRVRPGITGLWQVSGANALTDGDLFDLDMSYVVNRSFGLDLLLILRTVPTVLVRRAPS